MRKRKICFTLLALICGTGALRATVPVQTVILLPPRDPTTGKYDEGKACFSFKYGLRKQMTQGPWDLGYGFLSIGNEDWFILHTSGENRSVIRDLGELTWRDSLAVPALEPLRRMPKGGRREITIDSSADTGKSWAKTTNIHAKVATGHMYVVHVRDEAADFYVMFRVEEFKQNSYCKFSWRLVPSPPRE